MRQTVTIPADGKKLVVDMTGRSLIIEEMGAYPGAADVPLMNFSPGVNGYPLYNRSSYPNSGEFKKIEIIGTAESAGDEIALLSTDQCLELDININFLDTKKSTFKDTTTKAASDAVQSFAEGELVNDAGQLPVKMYVYVLGGATRGINYAFGSNPTQGNDAADCYYWDNERDHQAAGDLVSIEPLEIIGINWILGFKFIATVLGETPVLVYTLEY